MFKSDAANWALAFLILFIILGSLGFLGVVLHRASANIPSRSDRSSSTTDALPQGRAERQPHPSTTMRASSSGELLKAMLSISTLAIIVGIVLLVKPRSSVDDIRCDGRPMSSSDVCAIYSNGSTEQKSYGQMVSENTKNRAVQPIIGAASLGGGVLILLVTVLVAAGREQGPQPSRAPTPSVPSGPPPARARVAPPPKSPVSVSAPSETTAKPPTATPPTPPAGGSPPEARGAMTYDEVRRWLKTGQARRTSTGSLELTAYGTKLLGLATDHRASSSTTSRSANAARRAEIEQKMNDADPTHDNAAGTPSSSAPRVTAIPTYLPDKTEIPLSRAKQRFLGGCMYRLATVEDQHGGFLGAAEDWTRRIGRDLHDIGGMDLMRRAHREIVARTPSKPHLARELDVAWNGVGDWRG